MGKKRRLANLDRKKQVVPWRVRSRKYVLKTPWLSVVKERVLLPWGRVLNNYYSVVGTRLVAVLLLDDQNQVLLVKQYRHPVRKITLDLPGGTVIGRETVVQATRRELFEETGYRVSRLKKLLTYFPDSGKKGDTKTIFLGYLSQKAHGRIQPFSREKGVEPVWVPLDKVLRMLKRAQGLESTLCLVVLYWKFLTPRQRG